MNKQSCGLKHKTTVDYLLSNKADAVLLFSSTNRFWFTGIESEFGISIITKNKSYLFVDGRDYEHCKKEVKFSEVILYNSLDQVKKLIANLKLKHVLIEKEYITLQDLENTIKPLKIKKITSFISDELRIVKTPEELSFLAASQKINAAAMAAAHKWIKVGITELEVKKFITNFMINNGATRTSFDLIVAFGENSAVPHHQATDRKLKKSEFIKLDIGCVYKGYCSDMTRTFWLGKPTKEMIEIYEAVTVAHALGLKACRAGITGKALDNVCRNFIDSTKFKGKFIHGTGHGLGIHIHELPNVKPTYDKKLPKNSVVTIEPGIYVSGLGGVRIEDSVVVK